MRPCLAHRQRGLQKFTAEHLQDRTGPPAHAHAMRMRGYRPTVRNQESMSHLARNSRLWVCARRTRALPRYPLKSRHISTQEPHRTKRLSVERSLVAIDRWCYATQYSHAGENAGGAHAEAEGRNSSAESLLGEGRVSSQT